MGRQRGHNRIGVGLSTSPSAWDAATQAACAGEIGPVGSKAFLHGYTATMAVFLDP